MVKFDLDKIKSLEKIYRLNLINSCTGYKSANLIGSIDEDGNTAKNITNENFQSFEGGLNYRSGNLALKTNYYSTNWNDRNLTKPVTTGQGSSGDTEIVYLTGVNQTHSGFELEASMQVVDMLRVDAAVGLGNWKFVDDANGTLKDEGGNVLGEYR